MLSFSLLDEKHNNKDSTFLKGFFPLKCKLLDLKIKSLVAHNSLCNFKCLNYFKYIYLKFRHLVLLKDTQVFVA